MDVQNVIYTFYSRRSDFVSNDTRFNNWVLVAPERGEFRFSTQHQSGVCGFGSLVVVAPQQKFERFVNKDELTYHVLQWTFETNASTFAEGLHMIGDVERLASNFARLRPLLGRNNEWAAQRRENLLHELLLLSLEEHQQPGAKHDEAMQHAAQLLAEKASQAFSIRLISTELGLSPVQFTRRFHAARGQTPIEFVTQIRLENAAKLLIETNWTLERIAHNCGYATPFYLSSLFSRRFGQSPSQFRLKHRV